MCNEPQANRIMAAFCHAPGCSVNSYRMNQTGLPGQAGGQRIVITRAGLSISPGQKGVTCNEYRQPFKAIRN